MKTIKVNVFALVAEPAGFTVSGRVATLQHFVMSVPVAGLKVYVRFDAQFTSRVHPSTGLQDYVRTLLIDEAGATFMCADSVQVIEALIAEANRGCIFDAAAMDALSDKERNTAINEWDAETKERFHAAIIEAHRLQSDEIE